MEGAYHHLWKSASNGIAIVFHVKDGTALAGVEPRTRVRPRNQSGKVNFSWIWEHAQQGLLHRPLTLLVITFITPSWNRILCITSYLFNQNHFGMMINFTILLFYIYLFSQIALEKRGWEGVTATAAAVLEYCVGSIQNSKQFTFIESRKQHLKCAKYRAWRDGSIAIISVFVSPLLTEIFTFLGGWLLSCNIHLSDPLLVVQL